MDLRGRVALVTGGAHRAGRAIVLALGRAGARVVIHYHRSAEPAQGVQAELAAIGAESALVSGDLAVVAEAERVTDEGRARWGQLDLLVNSAGIWGSTPIGTVTQAR